MLQGPDVSSWQGFVDWPQVAASGRAFAWTKATEGAWYVNPTFAYNWSGIKAAGMVRGAYHFGRPDQSADPAADADDFLSTVGELQPGDLLALDLEAGAGNLLDWALVWLEHVASQAGFKPMLYSGSWFMQPHGLTADGRLAQYPLWLSG